MVLLTLLVLFADLTSKVDDYLQPLVESRVFSGCVLLAKGDEVVVSKAYGEADLERGLPNEIGTQFKLMSVTKAITALAIMRLEQEGRLGLDDAVGDHLPSWPPGWSQVRLRHLLSHTSGISNLEMRWAVPAQSMENAGLDLWGPIAKELQGETLAFSPGTQSQYSNFNFVLLGLVVETVSGAHYRSALKRLVLDPLDMKATDLDDGTRKEGLSIGYFRREGGRVEESRQNMSMIAAAGGLYSTVADLFKVDQALRSAEFLAEESLETLWKPLTDSFAAGWMISPQLDRPCRHHSGGANGYVANFLRFYEEDACVIVLSNYAFAPVSRISLDLAAILLGDPYPSPQRVGAQTLNACVGNYSAPNGRAVAVRRSGDLLLAFEIYPGVDRIQGELAFAIGDDTFAKAQAGATLQFGDIEGDVASTVTSTHGAYRLKLDRVAIAPEVSGTYVGTYRPLEDGAHSVEILEQGDSLAIATQAGRPTKSSLIPVTDSVAIALIGTTFGTRVSLEPHKGGIRMRWARPNGAVMIGFKKTGS